VGKELIFSGSHACSPEEMAVQTGGLGCSLGA
jgi:hypothetical protein